MGVWNAYGELCRGQLEQLSSDPGTNLTSRIIWNTTSGRAKVNTGSAWVSLLWNTGLVDDYLDFANVSTPGSPSASNSIRLYNVSGDLRFKNTAGTVSRVITDRSAQFETQLTMVQVSTPASPSAGYNRLYFKSDNNLYSLTSGGVESLIPTTTNTEPRVNLLLNSNFDHWQAGTSINIANAATNRNLIYQADQWYVFNNMGTNAVATFSRGNTNPPDGSTYYARVVVQTAPTASHADTMELCQTLENMVCRTIYNNTCSVSLKVRAVGNVNQVAARLMYKTSVAAIFSTDGNAGNVQGETTVAVSTGSWATLSISNISMSTGGTGGANDGVFGIVIRSSAVSSGNVYDLGNGYEVTQVMWNFGTSPATYQPQFKNPQTELAACQRFYVRFNGKSWIGNGYFEATTAVYSTIRWPVRMYAVPTIRVSANDAMVVKRPSTGNTNSSTGIVAADVTVDSADVSMTTSAASTVGYGTMVGVDTSDWLEADARL